MSSIASTSMQFEGNLPTSRPANFTDCVEMKANYPYTTGIVKVWVDPSVYRDDPEKPYAENLQDFVYTENPSAIRLEEMCLAVYPNDKRYEREDFREQQAERVKKDEGDQILWTEKEFIKNMCWRELAYLNRSPQLAAAFHEAISQVVHEEQEKYRREYEARLANRSYFQILHDKIRDYTLYPVKKAMDFVGKEGDPVGERRRIAVLNIATSVVIAAGVFFFSCSYKTAIIVGALALGVLALLPDSIFVKIACALIPEE